MDLIISQQGSEDNIIYMESKNGLLAGLTSSSDREQ